MTTIFKKDKEFNCPKCYTTSSYTIGHSSEAEKERGSNRFILSASLMVFCNTCNELAVQLVTRTYTEGESAEREEDIVY